MDFCIKILFFTITIFITVNYEIKKSIKIYVGTSKYYFKRNKI